MAFVESKEMGQDIPGMSEEMQGSWTETRTSYHALACPYSYKGCKTKLSGEEELLLHGRKCVYQDEVCPQCEEHIILKDLPLHVERFCPSRMVFCPKCHLEFQFSQMEDHQKTCLQKRIDTNALVQEAEGVVECGYKDLGCIYKSSSENMAIHSKDVGLHLRYIVDSLRRTFEVNGELRNTIQKVRQEIQSHTKPEVCKQSPKFINEIQENIRKMLQSMRDLTFVMSEIDKKTDEHRKKLVCVFNRLDILGEKLEFADVNLRQCLNSQKLSDEKMRTKFSIVNSKLKDLWYHSDLATIEDLTELGDKERKLDLTSDIQVNVSGKTFQEIRDLLYLELSQLNTLRLNNIAVINTRTIWEDDFRRTGDIIKETIFLEGVSYNCEFEHWRNIADRQCVIFSIYPQEPTDPILCSCRAICCILDPDNQHVLYYTVKEGWRDNPKSKSCGFWFVITKNQYQQLKARSKEHQLQAAFIVYNI